MGMSAIIFLVFRGCVEKWSERDKPTTLPWNLARFKDLTCTEY